MVTESIASSTDLFDIVVSRKFVAGMPEKVVRKISACLEENVDIFSDKQQRYLASTECPIVARLTIRTGEGPAEGLGLLDEGNEEPAAPSSSLAADTDSVLDMLERKAGDPAASARRQEAKRPPSSSAESAYPTPQSALAGPPPTEKRRDRALDAYQKEREVELKRDRAPPPPPGGGGTGNNSQWESVKDEWAVRRQESEKKENKQREDAKRADKKRNALEEAAAAVKTAEQAEAERIRKLQDEADALMGLACEAPTTLAMASFDDRKGRSLSRSS